MSFHKINFSFHDDSRIMMHLFRKTPLGGKVSDVFSFSGQAPDTSKPAPPRVNRSVSAMQEQGSYLNGFGRQRSSFDLGGEDTNKAVERQNSEPGQDNLE